MMDDVTPFSLVAKCTHIAPQTPEQLALEARFGVDDAQALLGGVSALADGLVHHADLYMLQALLLADAEVFESTEEAIVALHKATNLADQYHPLIHFQGAHLFVDKAQLLRALGRGDDARADYNHAIFLDHNNPAAIAGLAALDGGDLGAVYAQAEYHMSFPRYVDYHKKVRLSMHGFLFDPVMAHDVPSLPIAPWMKAHDRAYDLLVAGDMVGGIAGLREVLEENDSGLFALHHLGQSLAAMGELDEALVCLEKAALRDKQVHTEYHADSAWYYYNRGCLYTRNSEWDMAINDFTKALNIKTDHYVALQARGDALAKKGKSREAEQDWEKAKKLKC